MERLVEAVSVEFTIDVRPLILFDRNADAEIVWHERDGDRAAPIAIIRGIHVVITALQQDTTLCPLIPN